MRFRLIFLVAILVLAGCVRLPARTTAVSNLNINRYLGRWYEIARLNHFFEKGLDCVTATYTHRENGGVVVVNRGVDLSRGKVESITGKAFPVSDANDGRFKVSFFGPFYGGYNVLVLSPTYQYAIVAGPTHGFLWILARSPQISPALQRDLVAKAGKLGFDTEKLVYPEQGAQCHKFREGDREID